MFKVNEYYDGKVMSIAFQSTEGPATAGVVAPGEYEFTTAKKEVMTVSSGALVVKLPERDQWQTFNRHETFTVEPNQTFQVKAEVESAYICVYL